MTQSNEAQPSTFTFENARKFTGKIQYRTDDMDSVVTPFGVTRRGEVKEVRSERAANSLVENGDHIHVPADTPVGVPAEVAAAHGPASKVVVQEKAESGDTGAGSNEGNENQSGESAS